MGPSRERRISEERISEERISEESTWKVLTKICNFSIGNMQAFIRSCRGVLCERPDRCKTCLKTYDFHVCSMILCMISIDFTDFQWFRHFFTDANWFSIDFQWFDRTFQLNGSAGGYLHHIFKAPHNFRPPGAWDFQFMNTNPTKRRN